MCWFRPRKCTKVATGAGVIFTDGKLMLCGYQPHKPVPFISGIGGKCEDGEDKLTCAIREMIEELFEIKYIVPLIISSMKELVPKKVIEMKYYYIVIYSFEDLDRFLKMLSTLNIRSPLYETFPTCLTELLFNRKTDDIYSEISHLALLPVINHPNNVPFIDSNLLDDMRNILT
jgi:hypothetical protein